ncbi:hypothetical protein ECC02_009028 [Trypanosoma cruzi]|uniref:Uncharacterized protein n=1 Tax=Trypanosoma cruzi TaxID=5693 RepID=A0A7J6XUZ5_TRYCR|nr:hypothetical protein ECC02_009028 [Trypanosoma cruzi]
MLLPRTDSHDPDTNDADPRSTSSAPSVSAPALSFTTTADALATTPLSNTNPCAAYTWLPDTRSTAPPDATTRALAYNAYSPPTTAASSATPPPKSSSTAPSTTTVRPPVITVTRATPDTTSTDRTSRRPDSTSTGAYGEDREPGRYTSGVDLAATSRESVTVSTDPAGTCRSAQAHRSAPPHRTPTAPPARPRRSPPQPHRATLHRPSRTAQQRSAAKRSAQRSARRPAPSTARRAQDSRRPPQRGAASPRSRRQAQQTPTAPSRPHGRKHSTQCPQRAAAREHPQARTPRRTSAAAQTNAHTVPHARRRRPGRVAVHVPVAGVAPNNVDAPSVAKTSRCVLLRRRQDTPTSVVACHPQMRPSRKRQAHRQHPRQQHSVAHKAQRAPSSGHGANSIEHLPRDTVVHVALRQQHRPTSQAHSRIKRHRVVLRQHKFAPHKRHSGARHAHSPTHRHRMLAQQEVAVNKRHHGAAADRNTVLHRHAQPQRRLHQQPVHVQRTVRRQRHAANKQHANSVTEHSRHLRARNGQHAPRQIHVVQHEARGGVAKIVGAAVRNTRLRNQHRVHHSDARARRKSVRHHHAAAGTRLKPADQHIGALASRRVGQPPNNVQARSTQKRAVRQRHVAHAPRHRLHVHHNVRRKGHTNVARHRRPETGTQLHIHTHVPHAQVGAVGARWLGDSNGQARIAMAALRARAGAAITRGNRCVSGEARRCEGAWIAAGQECGIVHGRDAVLHSLTAVHGVARGHNRSVCEIAGPFGYPQHCRRARAGHELVARNRHRGVTKIHRGVKKSKGFRWGFTAEVAAQLQPGVVVDVGRVSWKKNDQASLHVVPLKHNR